MSKPDLGESRGFQRAPLAIEVDSGINLGARTKQEAKARGYTGDVCPTCGGLHMAMAGHCQVCTDCGTTTGCS